MTAHCKVVRTSVAFCVCQSGNSQNRSCPFMVLEQFVDLSVGALESLASSPPDGHRIPRAEPSKAALPGEPQRRCECEVGSSRHSGRNCAAVLKLRDARGPYVSIVAHDEAAEDSAIAEGAMLHLAHRRPGWVRSWEVRSVNLVVSRVIHMGSRSRCAVPHEPATCGSAWCG